jgi:hypothetical protein
MNFSLDQHLKQEQVVDLDERVMDKSNLPI